MTTEARDWEVEANSIDSPRKQARAICTVLAIPKGRVLRELEPLLQRADISMSSSATTRRLRLDTNRPDLVIVFVKGRDIPRLLELGSVDFALLGSDIIDEAGSEQAVRLLDLRVGCCRISLAAPVELEALVRSPPASGLRVVTRYPATTRRYFKSRGIEVDCVELHGSVELGPSLGLGEAIVDIVLTGQTLRDHGLSEIGRIADVSTYLVAARRFVEARLPEVLFWVNLFASAMPTKLSDHCSL